MSQPQVRGGGGGVGARNGGGNKRQQPSQDQKTNNNGGRSLSNFSFASLGESEEGGGDKRVGDESASRRTSAVTNTTQRHQSGSTSGAAISTTQQQQEISGCEKSKTAVATSNSHRLSSIDILNENKQRQLQLKQQESFKLHLEQRQKFIQQQQQQEGAGLRQAGPGGQGGANQDDDDETSSLGVTYQVNTSAPDYMASAVAKSSSGAKQAEPRRATSGGSVGGGWIAVNPFDDESSAARAGGSKVDALPKRPSSAAGGRFEDGRQHPATAAIQSPTSEKSATVSGFLSSLSDANDGPSQRVVDETGDELIHNSKRLLAEARRQQQQESGVDGQTAFTAAATLATRYTKVVEEGMSSYNYDDDPSKKPFYQKDFATLLQDCRGSRKLVIMIVAIALLLDNMLLTSVVPIIPAYLYKLRIERQHRELLENGPSPTSNMNKSQTAGKNWRPGQQQASQDDGGTAAVDEDELARRINQSLSAAKDRYSGSVFHPRVRTSTMRTTLAAADGDDDNDGDIDDQDDDAGQRSKSSQRNRASGSGKRVRPKQGGRKQTASKQRDGVGDSDDEDDGDDDDGDANDDDAGASIQSGRGRDKNPSSTRRVDQKNRKDQNDDSDVDDDDDNSDEAVRKGSRKSSRGRNQDDDDDGDDDDNGRQSTRISFRKRPPPDASFALSRSMIRDKTDSKARNNDDDDDEDRDNSAKWSKLRDSLVAMARKGSNDTEQLGGMCLTMVLNPDSLNGRNDNDAADDGESTSSNGNSKAEVEATSGKKQRNPRAQEMDDEDDGDDDGRLTANGKQRSRNKGPVRRVIKPKARPTTPSPSQNDQKKAGSGDDDDDELVISHQDIVDESFEVGVMFASKPIVQAFANPFIGTLTNRVGFTIPMFTGFVIMFLSTLVFAFGSTYSTLFIARAIQGVGSACTSVAGMSMLADRFPDDAERGNAMAIALGGLALGVVIGPPFGGFMYEFVGKASPFIVLSILALLDGLLQLMVLQPRVSKNQEEGASLLTLIKDPYILVAAGAITFANTGIAILEPALPLWMMDTMQAKNWEQGVAFLPAALSYMFGTNLSGNLGLKIGRWRATMIGLVIIGCSLLLIPFATRVEHLIVPNGAIGFAMGMVDSSMMPMLGYLVDIRHTSVYGSVYAIGDVAFCASFAFGPALSGTLVELIGFEGLIITTAIICFAFAPLLLLLRNPPARQVNEAQLQEQSMRYVNYNHLDSPDEEAQLTGDYKSTAKSYVR